MVTAFSVGRGTWLHGEGGGQSFLLRGSDGKMCCMGFLALACGVSEDAIMGRRTLGELFHVTHWKLLPQDIFKSAVADGLMQTNDRVSSSPTCSAIREERLIQGFKDIGVELTFTGSY